jgi:hypothetical protein
MASFRSNEEFFQAVNDLIAALQAGGHHQAAAELRDGFGCLNGLTDGSALFLEAIEKVQASESRKLDRDTQKALKTIRAAVRAAVYRH